ncbi:Proline dehydrogenase (Proline oxidase) / Delta-1-pyrroline-5-carboxylate dehydrogenase [Altererythrobacter epoxidivorans]|uniref:Bifunctional protein PutA n=1 Tax=Altererythrobacter epoxidivorans TaxID=361183 RepID=A0A0M4M9J7_9SPHN|nr:trifunctional transcriptional regulator/proline dehydrogenase/L-glutamate gamma-semialdehyde dehydrogenase [Altererythrobacter epoxidivorans]ALE17535.1 Proline dehydrogenase (Proline oxidase) / Delta-1-pyrroline-5-carboxylate dehydrogenase [Altererythrobacter epoxidivorans]
MPAPFSEFAPPIAVQSPMRQRITAAYRKPEADCIADLLPYARVDDETGQRISATAIALVEKLRAKGQRGGVEKLVKEYSLSSREGVALMCLAEALLRIPDNATRDALIRDKISDGDWSSHLGDGRSIFVNAATWGLVVTGKLVTPVRERSLGKDLTKLIGRFGEPVIRSAVNMAMEMMGEQFVLGETIDEALRRARKQEEKGFGYSYDMLGEAAMTMADAERYYADYESAIHAIGAGAKGRGVYGGPGISIKLSALHPRYQRAQAGRVTGELIPRVRELAKLAKGYDIGFNIDAEEADRLELSLDILEALALDPELSGWQGLGFVVQAYGRRCPYVIDWIVDLARRSGHRIMVRLVKGAYWDSEIKRAQVEGLEDFPVFTRKVHTDVSYIACAHKLLAARDHVFPQFATHNAQTVATIYHLAGTDFAVGDYEFQCLHGMGEPLFEEVVGAGKHDRPCRIYAPVGSHETLLAYLVRRLLENGANSSFVNQIWDENIPPEVLVADPVSHAETIDPVGSPHPIIDLPRALFPDRKNSRGLDLSNENVLAELSVKLAESAQRKWQASPMITGAKREGLGTPVLNPADHSDVVGAVNFATEDDVKLALDAAQKAAAGWASTPVAERSACLEKAADILEDRMEALLGLIMREAGKSLPNAIAEVREAVDFLRYYAQQACDTLAQDAGSLGPVVCISPWNFPLAIFTGEVAAALAAGNPVLAKPAEETPLIASQAVEILHEAGIPADVLQFVPGGGAIGAALVAAPETCGVLFTGSTEVAKLIQAQLAGRTLPDGRPVPLIAETGGQNAMIVDSSALPEQVARDVIASAFDSAGQRCSALRILCLQEDIADEFLIMLRGAMAELVIGKTDFLRTDIGPVITAEAQQVIEDHVEHMQSLGCRVERLPLSADTAKGTFVSPTIVEIDNIGQLGREVFGPVLHVLRYRRKDLTNVMNQIGATGYGLTFGIHSRIDETIADITARAPAGNIYVNRNVIGAIVGVQPFGGRRLSGTGPKAGGPLYLHRLVEKAPQRMPFATGQETTGTLGIFARWLRQSGATEIADWAERTAENGPLLLNMQQLPGPVGERNLYGVERRGRVLCMAETRAGLLAQIATLLATGNQTVIEAGSEDSDIIDQLPEEIARLVERQEDMPQGEHPAHVLIERGQRDISAILSEIAKWDGPIPIVQIGTGAESYRMDWMLEELSVSTDTTAAGGNASLMSMA